MTARRVLLLATATFLIQGGSAITFAYPPMAAPPAPPAAPPLLAQAPPPPATDNPPSNDKTNDIPAPPWARDLNLSQEQRSRLKAIHDSARQEIDSLQQKLMSADQQLHSLLQSDASIQQLRQQHQVVQQLRQELDTQHFEILLAERQVLTSDQLAKLIQQFRQPR